ncbi:unnamed protein product [Malassezia sympodialis ATCC 42132]|uniref:uncharacterized protein n=1 Tax=Malassezia sympodialis (strain ATCC 42132) TaxID=1230383 RepID=UPI0002C2A56F|nr:uncharacterized protein MSY001_0312 [Malassezia sympodialis ATCC 42132]CCU97606.1 unnamed protein product [Malassezia sympodialis ATCC 42132]|eukprot:XP_018738953.1 uncharacterized protein MSY001_0312 [Malassezia sympodialis ATCC 42132]
MADPAGSNKLDQSELLHTPRHVGSADPGTNTYLIMPPCDWNFEDRETLLPVMLVDTGDAREDYVPFLEQVLRGNLSMLDEGNGPVRLALTDMLRREAAPHVQIPVPRVHKFPDPRTDASFFERVRYVPPGAYVPAPSKQGWESVMWPLRDQVSVAVVDPENPRLVSTLRALYTPGHAADHVMFLLEEDHILLTGDNVLGRGSTVFEDLILYMHSLQRGLDVLSSRSATPLGVVGTPISGMAGENVLFPGHGEVVPKGKDTLRRYIQHRLDREEQLIALFACRPGEKKDVMQAIAYPEKFVARLRCHQAARYAWTLRQFVSALYENYSLKMFPAVARVLLLHLQKLATSPHQLKAAPFPTREAVPSIEWHALGPLVRCMHLPKYQYSGMPWPDLPRSEDEWREVWDLPWQLTAT